MFDTFCFIIRKMLLGIHVLVLIASIYMSPSNPQIQLSLAVSTSDNLSQLQTKMISHSLAHTPPHLTRDTTFDLQFQISDHIRS